MNLDFNELPLELYSEIFGWLKPYSLSNVSFTSKHYRQLALTEALWKKHLDSEFPYSFEKGTSFQQYSICKYKSLRHIPSKLHRKCLLQVEAGHLNEIMENLPELKKTMGVFLNLKTHDGKYLIRLLNEQDDPTLKDFFYSEIKHKNDNFWAIKFGKVNDLVGTLDGPVSKDLFGFAIDACSIESLDYLFKQNPALPMDNFSGAGCSFKIANWLYDHGTQFGTGDFYEAAQLGNTEFIQFMLEKYSFTPEQVKCAIYYALSNGRPGTLEELLSHFQHDKSDLNHFLEKLNFVTPIETAACLKILLDKGADVEYLLRSPYLGTPLFVACSLMGNENSIELLLSKKANPNVVFWADHSTPLVLAVKNYKSTIVQMLIDHGAEVTSRTLSIAQQSLRESFSLKDRISENIELLKNHLR